MKIHLQLDQESMGNYLDILYMCATGWFHQVILWYLLGMHLAKNSKVVPLGHIFLSILWILVKQLILLDFASIEQPKKQLK